MRSVSPVSRSARSAPPEASDDVHRLLKVIAVAGAEALWADAMASSAFAYRSALIAKMKRLWGCFLSRENARLKIARLEHVSGATNNRTHAARGPSRAQRARDDANFFLFHQHQHHGARSSPSSWLVARRRLDQGRFSVVACSTRPRPRACETVFPTQLAQNTAANKRRS